MNHDVPPCQRFVSTLTWLPTAHTHITTSTGCKRSFQIQRGHKWQLPSFWALSIFLFAHFLHHLLPTNYYLGSRLLLLGYKPSKTKTASFGPWYMLWFNKFFLINFYRLTNCVYSFFRIKTIGKDVRQSSPNLKTSAARGSLFSAGGPLQVEEGCRKTCRGQVKTHDLPINGYPHSNSFKPPQKLITMNMSTKTQQGTAPTPHNDDDGTTGSQPTTYTKPTPQIRWQWRIQAPGPHHNE